MSKILDYDEVSTVYDRDRAAVGVDVIAGLIFIHGGKPLKVGVYPSVVIKNTL